MQYLLMGAGAWEIVNGAKQQSALGGYGAAHRAYTLHHNGVSERMMRTIAEVVRCMLHHSGLEPKFLG